MVTKGLSEDVRGVTHQAPFRPHLLGVGGDEYDRNAAPHSLKLITQLGPAESRHANVENQAVRLAVESGVEKRHPGGKGLHLHLGRPEQASERFAYGSIIIDHNNEKGVHGYDDGPRRRMAIWDLGGV